VRPLQPHPRLLRAAESLAGWADFLVITANAPHLFREAIERAFGGPLLSMIDLALDEVRRRGLVRVGVLGLGEPTVYLEPLGRLGLDAVTPDGSGRARLDEAIFALMEGRDGVEARAAARGAVADLRARGADGIILGCTEVPLLLGAEAAGADLINPAQLLAEAAVRRALG
jgi:aspartate racemase